ncbi:hypothetical protein M3Y96_00605900 [Aphelenchoides besseyi]|nr:hypothetical protein M3Y96_00605900 [Aphelenchoides besseyi]
MVECAICQAEDGGMHYGGICCSTVRLKLNYKCKFKGDCQIRPLDRRACRSCRLEKCQRIGMNSKHQMSVTDCRTEEWHSEISTFNGPLAEHNLLLIPDPRMVNSVVDYIQKIDLLLDSYFEEVPSTYSNIELSVEQGFFFEPRRLSPRYKIHWEPLRLFRTEIYLQIWCRTLLLYVDWASHVLKLHNLSPSDKLQMTVGRCIVSTCLLIFKKSIPQHTKKGYVLMTENMYIPLEATELVHCKRDPIFDCIFQMSVYYIEQFVEPSRELNITEQELALLKLIAFFNAVLNLSSEGRKIVTDAQLNYTSLLIQLLRSKMDDRKAIYRMTQLLSLLPPLEVGLTLSLFKSNIQQLEEIEKNGMYLTTLLNYREMKGSLTEEFYIKRCSRILDSLMRCLFGGKERTPLWCQLLSRMQRRSVRLQRQYVCAYSQKCVIEKAFRNCCRACRFKKCLEIGLNPRLVHSDRSCDVDAPWRERSASNASDQRKPDSTTLDSPPGNGAVTVWRPKEEPIDVLDDLLSASFAFDCQILIESSKFKFEFENNGTLGSKQLIPLFDRRDIRSVVRYFLLVDEFIDNFAEHQHNHINSPLHFYDLHTKLEDAFYHQPRKMCQRSKARDSLELRYSSINVLQMLWQPRELLTGEAFRSVWCRIALHYVDWASFIPDLYELNVHDQLGMIVGRFVPLLWQIIAHRSYKNTNTKCVLTTGGTYVPLEGKEREYLEKEPAAKFAIEAGSWMYECFLEPAKELNITDAEFSLLRVIAFLSPVPQLSAEGRKIIREAQRFYQSCLLKLIQTQTDPISAAKRISELLLLLPPIEHVSTIEDNHMTVMTLFNQNNMKGDLTYAFYLQRHLRS